jgi:hypothetical protein
VCDEIENEET